VWLILIIFVLNLCDSGVYNFQISHSVMHKIDDSFFCHTCKCVGSKLNCLTCTICFYSCHVPCSLTSEQTSAALKFQEPYYCQNCLSKILPIQSVPDIQLVFSRLGHIYSCNLSNPDTYDLPNVHNPYFSTSDTNQMFTKATTNFSVFHLNIVSLYGLKSKPILVNIYIWELYIGTQTNSLWILRKV